MIFNSYISCSKISPQPDYQIAGGTAIHRSQIITVTFKLNLGNRFSEL